MQNMSVLERLVYIDNLIIAKDWDRLSILKPDNLDYMTESEIRDYTFIVHIILLDMFDDALGTIGNYYWGVTYYNINSFDEWLNEAVLNRMKWEQYSKKPTSTEKFQKHSVLDRILSKVRKLKVKKRV